MSALRSWFRGTSASSSPGKTSTGTSPAVSASTSTTGITTNEMSPADREMSDIEDAMASAALIMNDDIDGAEARLRLRKDTSAFHQLGLGVSTFMRSVLGFEKDIMTEASNRLLECEARAWSDMKKAQRDAGAGGGWLGRAAPAAAADTTVTTQIYPPGSEFALVHAEAQLMLAVLAVLHESLTEAIKGFYKLRKAFIALNAIVDSEASLSAGRPPTGGSRRGSLSDEAMPGTFDDAEFADLGAADVVSDGAPPPPPASDDALAVLSTPAAAHKPADVGTQEMGQTSQPPATKPLPEGAGRSSDVTSARDSDSLALSNPVDVFVHSGANMCFGILLLLISMVPPAFSRLLYIIGFKGDRERGVRLLWKSTKFANINGGMAGLVLLAYYNGLIGYSDILPAEDDIMRLAGAEEIVGYPKERCQKLLTHMQRLYPDSMLWKLEEARLLATSRRAKDAIAVLSHGRVGRMRQITALTKFELSLDAMCVLDWPLMRDTFLQCVELNDWSHALYYYNVGCAELELYRDAFHEAAALAAAAAADPSKAAQKAEAATRATKHKAAAETYLRKATTVTGKKRFMARQMPFDVFVTRKLAKWEERAKTLHVDLADAVGSSPAQEMVYLWNGSKRMSPDLLEGSLRCLAWERCTASAGAIETFKSTPDESCIASLCRVSLLRSLGRLDEAQAILDKDLLVHDRAIFKGPLKDDYLLAAATYEAAVILWTKACDPAWYPSNPGDVDAFRREKVEACQVYLDKVAKWETFVLDARIGMRLQTGLDTVRWLKKKENWV
ncbi:Tetratricopeptide repeat protein 39 [Niveomyces insectorum RCEF 264]|uniref:Inclusion body clearance protein IML2 n=1 Tax=Niveomyces insectorum RCEF 264 TaxID=1081102 RepID=A0A167UQJ8_9HYPO|nr:Tetratricopeptide repeat protein 39 [Niveomyces insectorum RCEF 264]